MKGKMYLFYYLSALVIGILLLVFHDHKGLYEGVVIAIGVLVVIPSLVMLISSLVKRKDAAGLPLPRPWYSILTACAGLIFGVWLLCMPSFFINASIYTLGVLLVLAAAAQVYFVIVASRPAGIRFGWLIVPILCATAGVIIMLLGPDKVAASAGLITGIALIVYGANGVASYRREGKIAEAVMSDIKADDAEIHEAESKPEDIKKIEE